MTTVDPGTLEASFPEVSAPHLWQEHPRRCAMAVVTALLVTYLIGIGIPTDPITGFVWLWLFAVAWRWGQPSRRHLDFARDWWPALMTLVIYTYTRAIADQLGTTVHVGLPIRIDTFLGGGTLPAVRLQRALCGSSCLEAGTARWYDTVFFATYVTHFVFSLLLALLLWLHDRHEWRRWMRRYLTLNLAGLAVYVCYPAAPPWMASQHGAFPEHVARLTGRGGGVLGIRLARLAIGPIGNDVAAMPSLHAGTAFLLAFYLIHRFRHPARWLLLAYPATMTIALVYFGEHYVVDALAGALLAALVMKGSAFWEDRWGRNGTQPRPEPAASARGA